MGGLVATVAFNLLLPVLFSSAIARNNNRVAQRYPKLLQVLPAHHNHHRGPSHRPKFFPLPSRFGPFGMHHRATTPGCTPAGGGSLNRRGASGAAGSFQPNPQPP